MRTPQFERSTTGPKYEYVTFSSDLWFDLRTGNAVAGGALIGPAEDDTSSTISGSAVYRRAATRAGSGPGDRARPAGSGSGAIRSRACNSRSCRGAGRRREQALEIDHRRAAWAAAVVDVHFGGHHGES